MWRESQGFGAHSRFVHTQLPGLILHSEGEELGWKQHQAMQNFLPVWKLRSKPNPKLENKTQNWKSLMISTVSCPPLIQSIGNAQVLCRQGKGGLCWHFPEAPSSSAPVPTISSAAAVRFYPLRWQESFSMHWTMHWCYTHCSLFPSLLQFKVKCWYICEDAGILSSSIHLCFQRVHLGSGLSELMQNLD